MSGDMRSVRRAHVQALLRLRRTCGVEAAPRDECGKAAVLAMRQRVLSCEGLDAEKQAATRGCNPLGEGGEAQHGRVLSSELSVGSVGPLIIL